MMTAAIPGDIRQELAIVPLFSGKMCIHAKNFDYPNMLL